MAACTNLNGSLILLRLPSKTLASKIGILSFRSSNVKVSRCIKAEGVDLRPAIDENPEGIISGEWPENFSLLSYDDLRAYLETQIISDKMKPTALLGEVMSSRIRAATAEQTLEEIDHQFEFVSGLPVVDEELRCIGIVSKRDKAKASNGGLKKAEISRDPRQSKGGKPQATTENPITN